MASTPPSLPDTIVLLGGDGPDTMRTADIVPGFRSVQAFTFFVTGGGTFELRHSGHSVCGIPDEETIVMTGGASHNYVTRWAGSV